MSTNNDINDISVISAQPGDIPVLITHYRHMFIEICKLQKIELNEIMLRDMDNNYAEKLKIEIINGTCKAWLIKSSNKILASGAITIISLVPVPNDIFFKAAFLHSVYTEEKYRKKGYATTIIKAAIDYCKTEKINRLLLNTSNAGKPLYEKIGFEHSDNSMRLWIK